MATTTPTRTTETERTRTYDRDEYGHRGTSEARHIDDAEHVALSHTNDWELEYSEQDVRGWVVLDRENNRVARVDDMLVNTDTEHVDYLLLDNDQEIPVSDIHIGDDAVHVDALEPFTPLSAPGEEHRTFDRDKSRARSRTTDYDEEYGYYEPYFRRRHTDGDYENHAYAYRYGYEAGRRPEFRTTSFSDAKEDLRSGYNEEYSDRDNWKDELPYIEAGYEAGRQHQANYDHYRRTYGDEGDGFGRYAGGYRYGAWAARSDRYTGRSYEEAETDLRSDYEKRYGDDRSWEDVQGAVRHGYNRTLIGGSATAQPRAARPTGSTTNTANARTS